MIAPILIETSIATGDAVIATASDAAAAAAQTFVELLECN